MKFKRSKRLACTWFACVLAGIGLSPFATIAAGPAAAAAVTQPGTEIDHALLWGRDIDQIVATFAVKLGFQVRPGREPGGVANRYVRMADLSYLELFAKTRAEPDMDPGMRADQASLRGGAGARTFGLRSSALERAHALLKQTGFAPTPIFTAPLDDPDGDGPSHPPRWRLFAFDPQPLSSNLFFIDYAALRRTPVRVDDTRIAPQHPNGARELSALWLLSADAESDRARFETMGLRGARRVRIAQIAAQGYCIPVGRKRVYALQPDGAGLAADALRSGGAQILGLSIGVADLELARRRIERGYETALAGYRGALGAAFLAPTQADLGLWIEFHAASQAADGCGTAAE